MTGISDADAKPKLLKLIDASLNCRTTKANHAIHLLKHVK